MYLNFQTSNVWSLLSSWESKNQSANLPTKPATLFRCRLWYKTGHTVINTYSFVTLILLHLCWDWQWGLRLYISRCCSDCIAFSTFHMNTMYFKDLMNSAFEYMLKWKSPCHDTNPISICTLVIWHYNVIFTKTQMCRAAYYQWSLVHYFLSQAGGAVCQCCCCCWWCSGHSSYLSSASPSSRTFWDRHTENVHGFTVEDSKLPTACQTRNFSL